MRRVVYETPGTYNWVCPAGITRLEMDAAGAGGGGGGGGGGTGSNHEAGGGGGGGGAKASRMSLSVTPGTTYQIIIPSGGAGGAGSVFSGVWQPGTDGTDGSDTIFQESVGPVVLARFQGAAGGRGANSPDQSYSDYTTNVTNHGQAGGPVKGMYIEPRLNKDSIDILIKQETVPGRGGLGGSRYDYFGGHVEITLPEAGSRHDGVCGSVSTAGAGTSLVSYGGGGGGSSSHPSSVPGNGGDGAVAADLNGGNGGNGTLGAGGGGGGGAGRTVFSSNAQTGGAGGNGGGGWLHLYY